MPPDRVALSRTRSPRRFRFSSIRYVYGLLVQTRRVRQPWLTLAQYQAMDEPLLLAALQALLIYTLILLFPTRTQSSVSILPDALFIQLRDVVYRIASTGLMLQEETDHKRPSWESWIHIASKRRTILSLYLTHWSYSVFHHLPSFNCKDLFYIPAPDARYLWQAPAKKQWETLYNKWLALWDDTGFRQFEFYMIEPGVGLPLRAQLWLEDADEFGLMFVSLGAYP
jgi:hypothetical protein